jgi:hypothetical protein
MTDFLKYLTILWSPLAVYLLLFERWLILPAAVWAVLIVWPSYKISSKYDSFRGKFFAHWILWSFLALVGVFLTFLSAGAGMAVQDGGASIWNFSSFVTEFVLPLIYVQLAIMSWAGLVSFFCIKLAKNRIL